MRSYKPRPRFNPVWLFYPEYGGLREIVGGSRGVLMTNGTYGAGKVSSSGTSTGGVYWSAQERLKTISNAWTILVHGNMNDLGSGGHLLSVGANSGWTDPYMRIGLRRDTANTLQSWWYDGSNRTLNSSASAINTTDGNALYAVTMSAGNATFYRNDTTFGTGSNGTGVVTWSTLYFITLSNRHGTDAGEGTGADYTLGAIFPYAMSAGLIAAIAKDPSILIEPQIFAFAPLSPPPPPAPTADFSATPTSGDAPLEVDFTDASTDSPTSWAWDFENDGNVDSIAQNPTHTYTTAGTYTVKLTATNANGSDVETKIDYITVTEPPIPPPPALTSNATAARATWQFLVDWNSDGDFSDTGEDISAYVMDAEWQLGMGDVFQEIADETRITLTLRNDDRRFSPEYSGSPYYGSLVPQRAIRVRSTYDGISRTHWTGWIESVLPTWNERGEQVCVMVGVGAKQFLENTEVRLPLLENATADAIIEQVLINTQLPPLLGNAWLMGVSNKSNVGSSTYFGGITSVADLEVGIETFPYIADNWEDGVTGIDAIHSAVAGERGRFFFDREGKAVFWNRRHTQVLYDVEQTFTDTMQGIEYAYGMMLANSVEVRVYPRAISAGNTELLWELEKPLIVPVGEEKTVRARYVSAENQTLSARNVYFSGETGDLGRLNIFLSANAKSAEIRVINTGNIAAALSTLQLYGQTLVSYDTESVTERDGASIAAYGKRELMIDTMLLEDRTVAASIAQYELGRRKSPQGMVTALRLMNRNETYLETQLYLTIGSVIQVSETQTAHSARYVVIGERQKLSNGQKLLESEWVLEPLASNTNWLMGTTNYSEIGVTTRFGF